MGEWYVGQTGDTGKAEWFEWPGKVDESRYGAPGTPGHFEAWAYQLVFEDGRRHGVEQWQLDFFSDLTAVTEREYGIGPLYDENWLIVPEGNSKSTFIGEIALYHLETVLYPWVPIAASSREQAEILFGQAEGFIKRTPGLQFDKDGNPHGPYKIRGTRQIDHLYSGGKGMKVYAADHETADGVIPTLPIVDEGHRMRDLSLYRLWTGKLQKRHGRIVMISTAGEPGKDFEVTRRKLKTAATDVERRGRCFARYVSEGAVLHDYALPNTAMVEDLEAVKEANPLSTITVTSLYKKRNKATLDYGEGWLRLTCNIPARSSKAAINDAEWDECILKLDEWADAADGYLPEGVPVALGVDVAWVHDTTALIPMWLPNYRRRLMGPAVILEPPRDGQQLDPQLVHDEIIKINKRNPIYMVVMDLSRAQETAMWIKNGGEDGELNVAEVVDRTQSNKHASQDYEAFMEALRGGAKGDEKVRERWIRHTRAPDILVTGGIGTREEVQGLLREHVMNAIARKLPGDNYRFDRQTPNRVDAEQDHRVIDGLTAAAMVNRSAGAALAEEPLTPMVAVRGRR